MLTRYESRRVNCSICMQRCESTIGRIQCRHSFCIQCIEIWAKSKNKCPSCRFKITKIMQLKVGDLKEFSKKLKFIEVDSVDVESATMEEQSLQNFAQLHAFNMNIDNFNMFQIDLEQLHQEQAILNRIVHNTSPIFDTLYPQKKETLERK